MGITWPVSMAIAFQHKMWMLGTKGEAFLVKMMLFAHVSGNDWAPSRVEGTLPAAHAPWVVKTWFKSRLLSVRSCEA